MKPAASPPGSPPTSPTAPLAAPRPLPFTEAELCAPTPADTSFMLQALALARQAWGRTSPNPMVGCVIVRDGEVVARGYHRRAGGPHAEAAAFADAVARGVSVEGATLVVTLEPCSFHGRTPPCADACVAQRVGRVVLGTLDPNPRVSGAGVRRLLDAGIAVTVGVEEAACRRQNAPFFTVMERGRPHVTAKVAMSLDGKLATRLGESFPLTGELARERVHVLRDRIDAILVGRRTAALDDPRLTCRLPASLAADGGPRDPLRIVLDPRLQLPITQRVFNLTAEGSSSAATWLVVAEDAEPPAAHLEALAARGVEVVRCPYGPGGLDLAVLLTLLAQRGILSVLVEGGGAVLASLLEAGLIDVWVAHIAPRLIGGQDALTPLEGLGAATLADAARTGPLTCRSLGEDIEIVAAVAGDVYGFD